MKLGDTLCRATLETNNVGKFKDRFPGRQSGQNHHDVWSSFNSKPLQTMISEYLSNAQ